MGPVRNCLHSARQVSQPLADEAMPTKINFINYLDNQFPVRASRAFSHLVLMETGSNLAGRRVQPHMGRVALKALTTCKNTASGFTRFWRETDTRHLARENVTSLRVRNTDRGVPKGLI